MEAPSAPFHSTAPTTEERLEIVIYLSTRWPRAVLRHSVGGGPWKNALFAEMPDSQWHVLTLELNGREEVHHTRKASLLEFFLTDEDGLREKSTAGRNYIIESPGSYSIQHGVMEPVDLKPVMLVSDLDGTMVGNDAATSTFRHFWSRHRAATQSVLVYNTGRSFESFLRLLEAKRDCLEIPDVLICALGTKIYLHRSGQWLEDIEWAKQLEEGWDLQAVRNATQLALDSVGPKNMHARSAEEQNEHKVTCGVRRTLLGNVVRHIQRGLDAFGVQANIISCGIGEWRILDVVPKRAGKLEPLSRVRQWYGFEQSHTVACGDSGNDILMLSGENLAIVVGNAQPDLLQWVKLEQHDVGERLYLAEQYEAYGILEGLKRFGFY